ncbi:MAG TPA: alpha/beta hydrolase [Polyangiales bacterium]
MSWDEPPFMLKRRDAGMPAIAYRVFRPKDSAKVAVLMSSGYFENMKRYREVIERWNARGVLVAIYDLRGHGLSDGGRGQILRFDEYVDDAVDLMRELEQLDAFRQLRPLVLFGHSLGGLISIHTAFRVPDKIAGLALASPYLGLAMTVPAIKLIAGRALSRFVPAVSLDAGLKGSDCTHTAEISEAYDRDPMNFKKANVRWFTETIAAQERALGGAKNLRVPLFCLQAGDDRVALPSATERFMESVSSVDRQYLRLPGLYHEILNEPDRATWIDKFATAMLGWKPAASEPAMERRV